MGRYGIRRMPDRRLTVLFREGPGKPPFECGANATDTPIELLREWIINNAVPGDVIEFEEALFVMQKGGVA
jgi:hypothetical protein